MYAHTLACVCERYRDGIQRFWSQTANSWQILHNWDIMILIFLCTRRISAVEESHSPLKQFFIVWSAKLLQSASYWLFKSTTYRTNAQFAINYLKSNCHAYIIFHKIFIKLPVSLQFRGRKLPIFLSKQVLNVIIISINSCKK